MRIAIGIAIGIAIAIALGIAIGIAGIWCGVRSENITSSLLLESISEAGGPLEIPFSHTHSISSQQCPSYALQKSQAHSLASMHCVRLMKALADLSI